MAGFTSALYTFYLNLPLKKEFDPLAHIDYCYAHSLGCVGLLKSWFYRALVLALNDREAKPFVAYLERTRMATSELVVIMKRIVEGELLWRGREEHRGELEMLLGHKAGAGRSSRKQDTSMSIHLERAASPEGMTATNGTSVTVAKDVTSTEPSGRKRRHKPGVRNPRQGPRGHVANCSFRRRIVTRSYEAALE